MFLLKLIFLLFAILFLDTFFGHFYEGLSENWYSKEKTTRNTKLIEFCVNEMYAVETQFFRNITKKSVMQHREEEFTSSNLLIIPNVPLVLTSHFNFNTNSFSRALRTKLD